MLTITITSGIDGIVREIKFPQFRNIFLMSTMSVDGTHFKKYIIIDRATYIVLLTGYSYSSVIYKLTDLIVPMDQSELDELIRTLAE